MCCLLLFSALFQFLARAANDIDGQQAVTIVQQSNRTVTGTVSDNFGDPLPGVTIIIKGTTQGTSTDLNGEFTIVVENETTVLQFNYIGYEMVEVTPGARRVITVVMHEDTEMLDEVVVTAFSGAQTRESIVSSVTSVSPRQLRVPSSNLTTAFAGQIAGVIAFQRSGEPGLDNADFFIRGVTTFGTGMANPLILIDNVELTSQDLARLNPDDIASFSVLKDAAATALYGSRGANGVILVTTREGREGPVRVSARIENSWSSPTRRVQIADPLTFMRMHNEAVRTRDPLAQLPYSEASIHARMEGRNPYVFPMTNWMDELIKPHTMNQRGNMSLNGGGTVARYFVALNYSRDTGVLNVPKHHGFNNNILINQYGVRSNVNLRLTKTTDLAIRVSGSFTDNSGPLRGGRQTFRDVLRANPVRFPAYYAPDAAHIHAQHILFGNYGGGGHLNPFAELVRGYRENQTTSIIAQMELRQSLESITEGLRFRVMGNTTRNSSSEVSRTMVPFYYSLAHYNPETDVYTLFPINPETGQNWLTVVGTGRNDVVSSIYMETALNYDRVFDIHTIGAMLVQTVREEVRSNPAADEWNTALHNSMPFRNMGYAGRFTYGLLGRYFTEFNFGYNASERFDRSNRWGFFPSGGIGWRISNEPLYENSALSNVLNVLHFRATYGIVGNDNIARDRFFHLSRVEPWSMGMVFGSEFNHGRPGWMTTRYANPHIGWEVAHTLNLGLEKQFFNSLNIRTEYFTNRRSNILLQRADIPSTMGLHAIPRANVGEARGHGVDISVDYSHNFSKDFWVTARGNFTFAKSHRSIVEEPDYSTTPWMSRMGHAVNQQWGFIAERLFIDEEDVANSPRQMFGEYLAGDIKYMDINGDGIIDERDAVPIGFPTTPEIIYGFGFSAGFRNFDFSTFFRGSARSSFWIDVPGVTPFSDFRRTGDIGIGNTAVLQFIERDHWTEANQNPYAAWPRLSTFQVANNNVRSTWFMHSGDFLRLASMEIGYTLPEHIFSRAGLSSARVYLSGTNLLTFSSFKLWDVEMGGDGLGYPIQRVVNIGLHLSF
jgi:TonB-linked SusC/RagA family outer membrane protein